MYKHLTREQRFAIYLGMQKHETNKAIAQAIEVSESTVSREIKRNSTKKGKYVWIQADECARRKKCRAPGNRAVKPEGCWRVEQLIKDEQWSPKQIAGVLAKDGIRISHETIYKFIREDETGELARNCRDHDILPDAGHISHEQAEEKALGEYEKYRVIQNQTFLSDFDKLLDELNDFV